MAEHFRSPERFAAEWNAPERDAWQKPQEIVAALALEAGMTVADVGSGTGYLLPFLSRAVGGGGKVLALDTSDEMLAYLEQKVREEGLQNVLVQRADHDDPRLSPQSVDRLVILDTWHHIEQREAYAAKLSAALEPGGSVVIVDFLPEPTEGMGPPLEMRLSDRQVATELSAGGLVAEVVSESLPRHYIVRGTKPAH